MKLEVRELIDNAQLHPENDDEEEKLVIALSNGIYQVLQDNGRKLFDIHVEAHE